MENRTTPTYPILCNWSELLYASEALKVRADKIRARLHKAASEGRRTPNESHLRSELAALESVRVQMERAHDQHMQKVSKSIKELAEETERRIPCRCGVDVRQCRKGCTLFACCGGYTNEGHMSDCPGARPETVGGR